MITADRYRELKAAIIEAGYGHDIEWAENIKPIEERGPNEFFDEYAWVVINSGMKNQVAHIIWDRVRKALGSRGRVSTSDFGHIAKVAAINEAFSKRRERFTAYCEAMDKTEFMRSLPFIGPITVFHLAKNFGHSFAKPDRHLVRIAGNEGTHPMCARLAQESGDKVVVVDTVIWRAANLGMV